MFRGSSGAGLVKFQATSASASPASATLLRRPPPDRLAARSARRVSLNGVSAELGQPAGRELGGGRRRPRHPVAIRLDRLRHRLHVEEDRGDVDAGDAVDEGVVGLGDQREAVLLEALDQPELPERLRAVERLREEASRDVAQLLLRARRRQRRVADVVGEVEVGVVDPEGPAGLDRREGQLLAEARHQVQAAATCVEEVLVVGRRALEDQDRPHVHVRARGLVREERGVDRAQSVHVSLCHRDASVAPQRPGGPAATLAAAWRPPPNKSFGPLAGPAGGAARLLRGRRSRRADGRARARPLRQAGLRPQGDRPQQARRPRAREARARSSSSRRPRCPRARWSSSPPTASPRACTRTPPSAACGRSTRPVRWSPRSTSRRASSPPRATRSS